MANSVRSTDAVKAVSPLKELVGETVKIESVSYDWPRSILKIELQSVSGKKVNILAQVVESYPSRETTWVEVAINNKLVIKE